MYSLDFLNAKGRNFITKVQSVTRHFSLFLVKVNKPKYGIALI